jgi:hypothetical protein
MGIVAMLLAKATTEPLNGILLFGIATIIATIQFFLWFYVGASSCAAMDSLKAVGTAFVLAVGLMALAFIPFVRRAAAGIFTAAAAFGTKPKMIDVSGCEFPCTTSTPDPAVVARQESNEMAAALAYLGLFGAMIGYGVGDRFTAAC